MMPVQGLVTGIFILVTGYILFLKLILRRTSVLMTTSSPLKILQVAFGCCFIVGWVVVMVVFFYHSSSFDTNNINSVKYTEFDECNTCDEKIRNISTTFIPASFQDSDVNDDYNTIQLSNVNVDITQLQTKLGTTVSNINQLSELWNSIFFDTFVTYQLYKDINTTKKFQTITSEKCKYKATLSDYFDISFGILLTYYNNHNTMANKHKRLIIPTRRRIMTIYKYFYFKTDCMIDINYNHNINMNIDEKYYRLLILFWKMYEKYEILSAKLIYFNIHVSKSMGTSICDTFRALKTNTMMHSCNYLPKAIADVGSKFLDLGPALARKQDSKQDTDANGINGFPGLIDHKDIGDFRLIFNTPLSCQDIETMVVKGENVDFLAQEDPLTPLRFVLFCVWCLLFFCFM